MPATLYDIKKLIQQEFPGSSVDEIKERNHRIIGTFRWQGFKGKNSDDRNRLVTEKVRDRLGFDGLNVGVIYPLAPGETL